MISSVASLPILSLQLTESKARPESVSAEQPGNQVTTRTDTQSETNQNPTEQSPTQQEPALTVLSPFANQGANDASLASLELTEAEQQVVRDLQQRDREVRAHEQAHARVGGPLAGAPTFTFQTGPDGRRYAIGGEVQIDTSAEQDPEDTIRKLETVIRAALAPAEPSAQDRQVAQQAAAGIVQAKAELRAQQEQEQAEQNGTSRTNNQILSAVESLQALIEETQTREDPESNPESNNNSPTSIAIDTAENTPAISFAVFNPVNFIV